jgi:hypothetical protein
MAILVLIPLLRVPSMYIPDFLTPCLCLSCVGVIVSLSINGAVLSASYAPSEYMLMSESGSCNFRVWFSRCVEYASLVAV